MPDFRCNPDYVDMKLHRIQALIPIIGFVLLVACTNASHQVLVEKYIPDANSVPFDIQPSKANCPTTATCWAARYAEGGKEAKFTLVFETSRGSHKEAIPVSFGSGEIRSEADSDCSILLKKLKAALEAKSLPKDVKRVDKIRFDYAEIGADMSQSEGGGFSGKPKGGWSAMKLFIGGKNDPAEVFVNLNPHMGKAQFSIKDPDYGDDVLKELAKVL